jgi:hypothetical protein
MLNYIGIKKNAGFILYVGLQSQAAATTLLQVNPTIAAGDFKVSIDGGAFANLATLPVVTPAGGRSVKITLSAAEMNGDNIFLQCVDAAGAEWCDLAINVQTTPVDASVVQIDGTANASATFNLKKLNIVNSSGDAAVFSSTGSNGRGINASGNGDGAGLLCTGGATGDGIDAVGGATSGSGFGALATAAGSGMYAVGSGAAGQGFFAQGSGSQPGILAQGGATGNGIGAVGGATSGSGIYSYAVGLGTGITAFGVNGAGIFGAGGGSQPGILAQGGPTGNGIGAVGGATSGSGISSYAVGGGSGIVAVGVGGVSLLAAQGISGPLDASERNAIADAFLKRDWTGLTGEASRSVLNALRYLRNKWSISGSTLTVTKEDSATPAWTATLTVDATATPVVSFTGT